MSNSIQEFLLKLPSTSGLVPFSNVFVKNYLQGFSDAWDKTTIEAIRVVNGLSNPTSHLKDYVGTQLITNSAGFDQDDPIDSYRCGIFHGENFSWRLISYFLENISFQEKSKPVEPINDGISRVVIKNGEEALLPVKANEIDAKRAYTVKQAAVILNVSCKVIYSLIKDGRIIFVSTNPGTISNCYFILGAHLGDYFDVALEYKNKLAY